MNRRGFVKSLGLGVAGLVAGGWTVAEAKSGKTEVALTFDDPELNDYPGYTSEEVGARIRAALAAEKVKTVLFVCGMRVDSDRGRALVKAWNDDGHGIGNHSYSHKYFNGQKTTLEIFEADVAKGEEVVRGYSRFQKIFRYPFFKEGDTVEKRDGMRAWLKEHGYRRGGATIDASDWAIDGRMRKRLDQDAKADLTPYRDFLLEHIWARSQYYDGLAREVWKKPVRHTVLLHHRLLSALFAGDLMKMYREKGWKNVSADYAFEDPIYRTEPKIVPAGEGVVWALAKEKGVEGLRYPGEDDTYENPEMDKRKL